MDYIQDYGSDSNDSDDADEEFSGNTSGLEKTSNDCCFAVSSIVDCEPPTNTCSKRPAKLFGEIDATVKRLRNNDSTSSIIREKLCELGDAAMPAKLLGKTDEGLTGKIRSFPHVVGNFAVHVYIPVKIPSDAQESIYDCLAMALVQFPALKSTVDNNLLSLIQGMNLKAEYHVSLSRCVPIKFSQIDPLLAILRGQFKRFKFPSLHFDQWQAFVNDEGTRSFLSIGVSSKGKAEMAMAVKKVDASYSFYNLEKFYSEPVPHISLGWVPGNRQKEMDAVCVRLNSVSRSFGGFHFSVNEIVCKVGKRVNKVWVSESREEI